MEFSCPARKRATKKTYFLVHHKLHNLITNVIHKFWFCNQYNFGAVLIFQLIQPWCRHGCTIWHYIIQNNTKPCFVSTLKSYVGSNSSLTGYALSIYVQGLCKLWCHKNCKSTYQSIKAKTVER